MAALRALGRFLPDARDVPRGELRQQYKEGQEDPIGAHALVLNVVVLFNTRYLQAAVDELPRQGRRTTLAVRPSSREHSGALQLLAAGARRRPPIFYTLISGSFFTHGKHQFLEAR